MAIVWLDDDGDVCKNGEYYGVEDRFGHDFGFCCATVKKAQEIANILNMDGRLYRAFPVRRNHRTDTNYMPAGLVEN